MKNKSFKGLAETQETLIIYARALYIRYQPTRPEMPPAMAGSKPRPVPNAGAASRGIFRPVSR